MLALAHHDRDFGHGKAAPGGERDRFRLRIVGRIVRGEELDRAAAGDAKTRGRIGDARTAAQSQEPGEIPDSRATDGGRAEAVGTEIARTDDEVGFALFDGRARRGEKLRIVLTVAVDLRRDPVAVLARPEVPRLHRSADAEILREPQDDRALLSRRARGFVGRAVVDDARVPTRSVAAQRLQHAREVPRFVERRDDDEAAHRRVLYHAPRRRSSRRSAPRLSR